MLGMLTLIPSPMHATILGAASPSSVRHHSTSWDANSTFVQNWCCVTPQAPCAQSASGMLQRLGSVLGWRQWLQCAEVAWPDCICCLERDPGLPPRNMGSLLSEHSWWHLSQLFEFCYGSWYVWFEFLMLERKPPRGLLDFELELFFLSFFFFLLDGDVVLFVCFQMC